MAKKAIQFVDIELDKSNFSQFAIENIRLQATDFEADFADLDTVASEIISLAAANEPSAFGTSFDQKVAPVLHNTLRHLPPNISADPRMWQWLALIEYRELAKIRAGGEVEESKADYYLSGFSLGKQMGHALQRGFIIADTIEAVFTGPKAYFDTIRFMGNAQNVQSVGEGKVSFSRNYLRGKLNEIYSLSNDTERKNYIKKINAEAENMLHEYKSV